MKENIYIPCTHCSFTPEYQGGGEGIVALEGQWWEKDRPELLLGEPPKTGELYSITLHGPLKINVGENFWVLFMEPLSVLNGLDTEEGIDSIRFCRCRKEQILSRQQATITLLVRVLEIKDLGNQPAPFPPPPDWCSLLKNNSSPYRWVNNLTQYSMFGLNAQSDLGITIIVEKADAYRIVAVNEYDFHRNYWYLCRHDLTPEQQQEWGIR
jgi:hypothetical protein